MDDQIDKLLDEAEDALEGHDFETAAEACVAVLDRQPDNVDALFLLGVALIEYGDPDGAVEALTAAVALEPDFVDAYAELAFAYFELCRFDEARVALQQALVDTPELEFGVFVRALVAERSGDFAAADRDFSWLTTRDPEQYPEPIRMSEEAFATVVAEALDSLPEKVARWLGNVVVRVEPVPTNADILGELPALSPQLMGLFRGTALRDKSLDDPWGHLPDQIAIFQRNIERMCLSTEEIIEEIQTTVLHEIGHFLGLDEDEVARLGLT